LSVGLMPPKEAKKLSASLGIELEEHGFCKTQLENPVKTSRPGVFVCGAFGGPKDIPETVMEASAAAACAEGMLAGKRGTMITPVENPEEKDMRGQSVRTGVFVCHCGINMGGVFNVSEVRDVAATRPTVVNTAYIRCYCSQYSCGKMRVDL